jgi:hypothetical protein
MKRLSVITLSSFITSLILQSTVLAQSKTDFCQIYNGNLNQYVSQYDIFNHTAATQFRPFLQNYQAYKISNELIAQPLYYIGLSDGSIGTAFQLKGKLGNTVISNKDIVVQHINYYPMSSSFRIAGYCVNGAFYPATKEKIRSINELPEYTFLALAEARLGLTQEQVGNLFK